MTSHKTLLNTLWLFYYLFVTLCLEILFFLAQSAVVYILNQAILIIQGPFLVLPKHSLNLIFCLLFSSTQTFLLFTSMIFIYIAIVLFFVLCAFKLQQKLRGSEYKENSRDSNYKIRQFAFLVWSFLLCHWLLYKITYILITLPITNVLDLLFYDILQKVKESIWFRWKVGHINTLQLLIYRPLILREDCKDINIYVLRNFHGA